MVSAGGQNIELEMAKYQYLQRLPLLLRVPNLAVSWHAAYCTTVNTVTRFITLSGTYILFPGRVMSKLSSLCSGLWLLVYPPSSVKQAHRHNWRRNRVGHPYLVLFTSDML